jgi:hypothetical protein
VGEPAGAAKPAPADRQHPEPLLAKQLEPLGPVSQRAGIAVHVDKDRRRIVRRWRIPALQLDIVGGGERHRLETGKPHRTWRLERLAARHVEQVALHGEHRRRHQHIAGRGHHNQ